MWDKEQFKDEGKFKITYRYNGVIREAHVEEIKLSFATLYRMKGKIHIWDIRKNDAGQWYCSSPHKLRSDLVKIIGEAIEKKKSKTILSQYRYL